MTLPDRVREILDTIGQAAAEVPCAVEGCREFVSVCKAPTTAMLGFQCRFPYFDNSEWLYRVYRFRVSSELIEQDIDVSPDEFGDYQTLYLVDENMVSQVLSMWVNNLDQLGRPADCAIPV
jgi:hypothetical protein